MENQNLQGKSMKNRILNQSCRWMTLAAILALGISAGASLAEVTLLVPFWKTLNANDFFSWYQDNQERLVAFYSPLQIWSAVLALLALVIHGLARNRGKWMMLISTLFALGVLATFFMFFKEANGALAAGPMPESQLAVALEVWGNWQWIRIALGSLAFAFAVLAFPAARLSSSE